MVASVRNERRRAIDEDAPLRALEENAVRAAAIDDHLDADVRPTVVLMNPPFSAAAHVEGRVADAMEAVDLARLDHENIACSRFEFHAVDRPQAAALSYELDFVVGMAMRPWTARNAFTRATPRRHPAAPRGRAGKRA